MGSMLRKHRSALCTAALILFSILFIGAGAYYAIHDNAYFAGASASEDYYRARVLWVGEERALTEEYGGYQTTLRQVDLRVRLLDGFMKGEEVLIENQRIEYNSPLRFYPYHEGNEIFVTFNFSPGGEAVWYAGDHVRDGALWALVAAFLALLILFGRRKGVNTVVTLVFTVAAVFLIMIPAIIKGCNIYLLTFIIASFIIVMTLGIVSGVTIKSLSAAAGCIGGVGVAGLLTVVMQDVMKISGLVDEDSSFVMLINTEQPISLKGVIFGAIVIGALGAVMDVAMSIASSLQELTYYTPSLTGRELMRSGLNIGRDIMGTMANTLVLAYVGSSLNVILLLMAYNQSVSAILNREMVAVEVLQAVAGSIGILCAVPATALVTAALHTLSARLRRPASCAAAPREDKSW